MSKRLSIPLLTLALMLCATALTACNPVPPPIEGRTDPYGRRQVTFASRGLRNDTSVGVPTVQRDEAGILYVTLPITNTTRRPLDVEYRASFYDRNGTPTWQSTWFRKRLTPRVSDTITVNSTSTEADDFQIALREAR